MAVEQKKEEVPEASKTKKPAAPALNYAGSAAVAKPVKVDHVPGPARFGGGGRTAADIAAAFKEIEPHRGDWFQVAENVGNPGRYYDGFRALGATVRIQKAPGQGTALTPDGKTVSVDIYNIFAMVPEGELKPYKKKSSKKTASEGSSAPAVRK